MSSDVWKRLFDTGAPAAELGSPAVDESMGASLGGGGGMGNGKCEHCVRASQSANQ